jgi:hypothetical protein
MSKSNTTPAKAKSKSAGRPSMRGNRMDNDPPTPDSVLTSRHRARDLRALGKDELIQAWYRATGSHRRLHICLPSWAAQAFHDVILYHMTKQDTKLGIDLGTIAAAGDEFIHLASADPPHDRSTLASLVFCALHVLKLALEEDAQIDSAIDAMEITEAG